MAASRIATHYPASLGVAIGLAVAVAGCSVPSVIDKLPEGMGLPSAAPARPIAPYDYPAVHDMPPPRSTEPMSPEDQLKMEKDLEALRRQQAHETPGEPTKKPAVATKPQVTRRQVDKPEAVPPAKPPPRHTQSDIILVPPAGASEKP